MQFPVTVGTNNVTLLDFCKKNFSVFGLSTRYHKFFFRRISVMKIQTCRVGFAAVNTFCTAAYFEQPQLYCSPPLFVVLGMSDFAPLCLSPCLLVFSPAILADGIFAILSICSVSKTVQSKGSHTFIALFHAIMYAEYHKFFTGIRKEGK